MQRKIPGRAVFFTALPLGAAVAIILVLHFGRSPRPSIEGDRLRIVSLSPSVTEILFMLEVEDCLVGVTNRCDYPPAARRIERVGGFGTPSVERLVALSPDLIIATGSKRSEAAALERSGFPMLWIKTGNFEEIFDAIRQIGREVEKSQRADELVAEMEAQLAAIAEKQQDIPVDQRPRVFVEIWHDPLTTAGATSHVDEVVTRAGGVNVAREINMAYPAVNPEKVIQWDPDVIVLGYMDQEAASDSLADRIGWGNVKAVRTGRVINDIPSEIFLRPGPRLIEGTKALHERLYGEENEEARMRNEEEMRKSE